MVIPFEDKVFDLVWSFSCLIPFRKAKNLEELTQQTWGQSLEVVAAVQFIAGVVYPGKTPRPFKCRVGSFCAHQALMIWGEADRAAFVSWAENPWWC